MEKNICVAGLHRSLYGTRGADQNWYEAYSQHVKQIGFVQGNVSPCAFHHPGRSTRTHVHGDGYVRAGKPNQLHWVRTGLGNKYTVETHILGPGPEYNQQMNILNTIVQWDDAKGTRYDVTQLRLMGAKPVAIRGVNDEGKTSEDHDVSLGEREVTDYIAIVVRCNYLFPDRFDIVFGVKGLARAMAKPTRGDLQRPKGLEDI